MLSEHLNSLFLNIYTYLYLKSTLKINASKLFDALLKNVMVDMFASGV